MTENKQVWLGALSSHAPQAPFGQRWSLSTYPIAVEHWSEWSEWALKCHEGFAFTPAPTLGYSKEHLLLHIREPEIPSSK